MKFVVDPSIQVKVQRMKARVRWQEPPLKALKIDQTRLCLDSPAHSRDAQAPQPFSFLVLGDSGSRSHYQDTPQRRVAEAMMAQRDRCRFILHTGDVVYLVGSREQYSTNFIEPYRQLLVGGEQPQRIAYDAMCFQMPFLPVPGNHDYYDLPVILGLLTQLATPLRRLLRNQINLDLGWHGSFQGDAYARAFLDYLKNLKGQPLKTHLSHHYTAVFKEKYCLQYQPGRFTRLPNRYYQFRQEGIDFFALDSNTFNAPLPLTRDQRGERRRQALLTQQTEKLARKQQLLQDSLRLDGNDDEQTMHLADCYAKLEQVEERLRDLEKQLANPAAQATTDKEQLDWLTQGLIDSWQDPQARGRVLYFHHPPYVTETSKWDQGQTLAVRHRLRQVLDQVADAVGQDCGQRSLVDLVICGHAHCLEHLQTGETGHGDRNTNWLVCGGSGFSLRRQRHEGPEIIEERLEEINKGRKSRVIAKSKLFVGRSGQGTHKRRPYSFLRIDVSDKESSPIYSICPHIFEHKNKS